MGRGEFDVGEDEKIGGSAGILGTTVGMEKGSFHSYNCTQCTPYGPHSRAGCPGIQSYEMQPSGMNFTFGFEAYFLMGANFSVGWDLDYFLEHTS